MLPPSESNRRIYIQLRNLESCQDAFVRRRDERQGLVKFVAKEQLRRGCQPRRSDGSIDPFPIIAVLDLNLRPDKNETALASRSYTSGPCSIERLKMINMTGR